MNTEPGGTAKKTARRSLMDRVAARPILDIVLAVVLTGSYFAAVHFWWPQMNVLAFADSSQRLAVYAACAGLTSLIAGFSGTAIAQYGSSSGPVVEALRQVHGAEIRKNWLSIVRWLLAAGVLCIVAMVIDTRPSPRFSDYLFIAALILAILKFLRLTLLFRLILTAVDMQAQRPMKKKTPPYHVAVPGTTEADVIDYG